MAISKKTRKTAAAKARKAVPTDATGEPRKAAEYSIEELARVARTTVRNVRAYQDRGLIPAPERRGRVAVYSDEHVSRLRIIGQLLTRGYTLSSIGELLQAWEQGSDLAGLFGLESAVSSPWTDESPKLYSLTELVKMFGGRFDVHWLVKAADLKILVPEGARFRAPSPRMIQAGAELVKGGIPLDEMLEVVGRLRANVELAADQMVQLVEKYLFDPYGDGLPPPEEIPRLGEIIWRLRPLVERAVHAEVARAMEMAATSHLGDRLAAILDQMSPARQVPSDVESDD
ncbi:MAG: MerR family transcriptional regulator [Nevskiales bacterium]|nr:MerR family transcriptional regulator [Nevskiales bacterium]